MCFIKNEFEKHRQCVQVDTKRAAEEGGVAAPLPIPINDDSLRRVQHGINIAPALPPLPPIIPIPIATYSY